MQTFASSAGANPTNEARYFSWVYSFVRGSIFWVVPVFPATSTPSTAAFLPVPSLTTPLRISIISWLAFGPITRRTTWGPLSNINVPSEDATRRTTYGRYRVPPLAIADMAVTSWSGVTEISWPIGTDVSE